MASTFSKLKIELIATGEQSGTWGSTTNNNLGSDSTYRGLEQAIVGMATLVTGDFTSNSYTLPYTDSNDDQDFRCLVLDITATLSAAGTVTVPAIQKPYIVMNNSVGGYAVTVKVSGQTGVSVPNGAKILLYNNGTDVGTAITHLTSLTLGSALPVLSGGTGQTSYTNGQLLIGNTTGNTLTKATLTAGSGVTITNGAGSITIAATGLGGDVEGPASSTDNAFVRFDSTTGKLIQNSTGATLDDAGAPTFTGSVLVSGTSSSAADIRLYEDTDNGTNYVAVKAPAAVGSNLTLVLPSVDGSPGQALTTDGAGNLSFGSAGISTGKSIAMALIFGF